MRELANKRLRENFKESLKYLTLVFNDFFILALIFLFGALMFWYAQAMRTMPSNLWFYKPLVGLILWLPLLTGHLVTLIQRADMQFLFTQDEQMQEYLVSMHRYSLILPAILEILLAGIVFPFATVKAGMDITSYILFVLAMLLFKGVELNVEIRNLYFGRKINYSLMSLIILVMAILSVYIPITTIALSGAADILLTPNFKPAFGDRMNKKNFFDWRYAVTSERARKDRVYSIFSMFTDVSEKQVVIRRRRYLDFLLPKSIAKENPNLFLYRRSLLRNPDYLNLLVRMTAFAVLISWLVQDWRWACGLSALVIFLTAYQLMPMATEFDDNIMYRVYPIVRDNRGRDLVKVLSIALSLQWLLVSIFWLILLPVNVQLFEGIGLLLVVTLLMATVYLPNRVKRQKIRR